MNKILFCEREYVCALLTKCRLHCSSSCCCSCSVVVAVKLPSLAATENVPRAEQRWDHVDCWCYCFYQFCLKTLLLTFGCFHPLCHIQIAHQQWLRRSGWPSWTAAGWRRRRSGRSWRCSGPCSSVTAPSGARAGSWSPWQTNRRPTRPSSVSRLV